MKKSLLFVKFKMILPLLCFLLDPLTSKHCKTWSFIINLWIDSGTSKLNIPAVSTSKV